MSHVRKQIRDAAASALASLGGVHTSRVYPVQPDELPVLLVYTADEQIEGNLSAMDRRLELVVECVAQGESVEDELDTLLAGVEQALDDSTLGGVVVSLMPTSISVILSAEGSAPIGRTRITYEALYRTSFADPETSI